MNYATWQLEPVLLFSIACFGYTLRKMGFEPGCLLFQALCFVLFGILIKFLSGVIRQITRHLKIKVLTV